MNRKLKDQEKMSYFHEQKENTGLVWSPPWAAGGSLLHYGLPLAAGALLPHHGLHHRVQWNLSSGSWTTSSPLLPRWPCCLHSCSLTYSHSSLYVQLPLFLPLFNSYPSNATTTAVGFSLGQGQVCIGAGWHWFC